MKKSLSFKLILTLLMTFCIFSLMIPKTYALGDIISSADQFANMGETKVDAGGGLGMNSDSNGNPIKKMSDIIFNVLFILGIVIAVIWGLVIAIKFITGSVEEKAEVKKTLIPYVAGCVVLFGAFTIWKIVLTILQSN